MAEKELGAKAPSIEKCPHCGVDLRAHRGRKLICWYCRRLLGVKVGRGEKVRIVSLWGDPSVSPRPAQLPTRTLKSALRALRFDDFWLGYYLQDMQLELSLVNEYLQHQNLVGRLMSIEGSERLWEVQSAKFVGTGMQVGEHPKCAVHIETILASGEDMSVSYPMRWVSPPSELIRYLGGKPHAYSSILSQLDFLVGKIKMASREPSQGRE